MVEVKGSFQFPGTNGSTLAYSHLYELYNAHTGNLISVVAL